MDLLIVGTAGVFLGVLVEKGKQWLFARFIDDGPPYVDATETVRPTTGELLRPGDRLSTRAVDYPPVVTYAEIPLPKRNETDGWTKLGESITAAARQLELPFPRPASFDPPAGEEEKLARRTLRQWRENGDVDCDGAPECEMCNGIIRDAQRRDRQEAKR